MNNVSQEEIFEHYGISVIYGTLFCSPLRQDDRPTCSFKWIGEYLYFRDWAEENPINCFQLVMDIYNCRFYEALQFIYRDLIEKKGKSEVEFVKQGKKQTKKTIKPYRKKKIITKLSKTWQPEVADYLKSYYLTSKQTKKFNIIPIKQVWLENTLMWYYKKNDPAIGYYFGKDEQGNAKWKIYFFTRRNFRFMGNTNRINGWIQLPEKGELLIITKSLKDVACFDIFGIPAIAMQNETTIPYDYIIEELKSRFTNIISFYDFDRTGIINANKLKNLYNIPYLFLTNGRFGTKDYGAKDFSDYLKLKGKQHALHLLEKYNLIL